MWSEVFVSRIELQTALRDVFVLSQAYGVTLRQGRVDFDDEGLRGRMNVESRAARVT